MEKHTPGPWNYDEEGFIYGSTGFIVSDPHSSPEIDIEEREANALLLAAAPDLLAERNRLREVNAELTEAVMTLMAEVDASLDYAKDSNMASAADKVKNILTKIKEEEVGLLLWTADGQSVDATIYVLEAKGCEVVSVDKDENTGKFNIILSLPRAHANEMLGYEVGEEEWLKTEPLPETTSFPKPSGC